MKYRVILKNGMGAVDFDSPQDAIEYGEKENGRRMANVICEFDGTFIDCGEMKYEVSGPEETVSTGSGTHKVYRIKALRDFVAGGKLVKADDLGGLVGGYNNLDQRGGCWLFDNAASFGNGTVCGDACLRDEAKVFENGHVGGNADVAGSSMVYGSGIVDGNATVRGLAQVYGTGRVTDRAWVIDAGVSYGTVGSSSNIKCCGALKHRPICIENAYNGHSLTAYINPDTYSVSVFIHGRRFNSVSEFNAFVDKETRHNTQYGRMKTIVELLKNL